MDLGEAIDLFHEFQLFKEIGVFKSGKGFPTDNTSVWVNQLIVRYPVEFEQGI